MTREIVGGDLPFDDEMHDHEHGDSDDQYIDR
jgi:hypothetical protein